MISPMPDVLDVAEVLNANPEGWNQAMGVRFVKATADEVVAEWQIGPEHLQAYGIVHGGVHCGVIETCCSVGAAIWGLEHELRVAGLENHTSFLRALRSGARLRAIATPVSRGRRTQVWDCVIRDEGDREVASGRVRLICLAADSTLAGDRLDGPLQKP
jgi:1,4-dihydroxy-2-naphthoyl-CoA hydrolase